MIKYNQLNYVYINLFKANKFYFYLKQINFIYNEYLFKVIYLYYFRFSLITMTSRLSKGLDYLVTGRAQFCNLAHQNYIILYTAYLLYICSLNS